MSDGAAGVEAQHPAALLQPLVDGAPQTRQQNLTLPQAVDVNWKSSQELRKHQLQDEHDTIKLEYNKNKAEVAFFGCN